MDLLKKEQQEGLTFCLCWFGNTAANAKTGKHSCLLEEEVRNVSNRWLPCSVLTLIMVQWKTRWSAGHVPQASHSAHECAVITATDVSQLGALQADWEHCKPSELNQLGVYQWRSPRICTKVQNYSMWQSGDTSLHLPHLCKGLCEVYRSYSKSTQVTHRELQSGSHKTQCAPMSWEKAPGTTESAALDPARVDWAHH